MEHYMNMINENYIFSGALILMVVIAALEGVFMLLGYGLSHMLGNLFPDVDINHDLDIDTKGDNLSFGSLFNWLNKGGLPFGIWFILFLTYFGLMGIYLRETVKAYLFFELPMIIAVIMVLVIIAPLLRISSLYLSKILPKDESYSVSTNTFIGTIAEITIGVSKINSPAEAQLKDIYGQIHFVMVEPIRDEDFFRENEKVLLLEKDSDRNVFKVIRDPNSIK